MLGAVGGVTVAQMTCELTSGRAGSGGRPVAQFMSRSRSFVLSADRPMALFFPKRPPEHTISRWTIWRRGAVCTRAVSPFPGLSQVAPDLMGHGPLISGPKTKVCELLNQGPSTTDYWTTDHRVLDH